MKKSISLLFLALFTSTFSAQSPKSVATPTLVTDTLHYYFNKQYFKTGASLPGFPYHKAIASIIATNTMVAHVGSRFDVPDSVEVFGLEAFVIPMRFNTSTMPMRLYLAELNANGLPQFPWKDSVEVVLKTQFAPYTPTLAGGNFTSVASGTIAPASHKLKGSFAVLVRNTSGNLGDTICIMRTSSKTTTNTSAMINELYSEGGGYGFVMYNEKMYKTTDFNLWPGFGVGTDYEFLVAPRVRYSLQAGHIAPPEASATNTVCTRTPLVFTNASSPIYMHRQYNLCEFYRKWSSVGSLVISPSIGWPADFPISWFFEYDDNATPPRDPRKPLLQGQTTVSSETDLPGCYSSNSFRARLRKMSPYGNGETLFYNEDFTVCMKYCNGDGVGLEQLSNDSGLMVSPNPSSDGNTLLSGLKGTGTVSVRDISGREIKKLNIDSQQIELNFMDLAPGTYFVHVNSAGNGQKLVKVLVLSQNR